METRFERFTLRMMVACFVAMMAFAPATLLAGGSENKGAGKGDVIASSSDQGKKDTTKDGDKKDKEDDAKKGSN